MLATAGGTKGVSVDIVRAGVEAVILEESFRFGRVESDLSDGSEDSRLLRRQREVGGGERRGRHGLRQRQPEDPVFDEEG